MVFKVYMNIYYKYKKRFIVLSLDFFWRIYVALNIKQILAYFGKTNFFTLV